MRKTGNTQAAGPRCLLGPLKGHVTNCYFYPRADQERPLIEASETATRLALDGYAILPRELFHPNRRAELDRIIEGLEHDDG